MSGEAKTTGAYMSGSIGVTYGGYGGTRTPHFLEWGYRTPLFGRMTEKNNSDFFSPSVHVSPYNIQEAKPQPYLAAGTLPKHPDHFQNLIASSLSLVKFS